MDDWHQGFYTGAGTVVAAIATVALIIAIISRWVK